MAKKKITIGDAKDLAKKYGWDFSKDFYEQSTISKSEELNAIAKLLGYKKPSTASGSTARYFFEYLKKKKV
jgi:hypothetical protein